MTITHPQHPLCGQRVEIMRIRRGVTPDLIVRMPGGLCAALAVDWTDHQAPGTGTLPPPAPHLLAVEGLRQLAQLVAQFQHDEPAAAEHRAL